MNIRLNLKLISQVCQRLSKYMFVSFLLLIDCLSWRQKQRFRLLCREIAAELARQEEILAKLHEDMKKVTPEEVKFIHRSHVFMLACR